MYQVSERYSLLLEAYVKGCGRFGRKQFLTQDSVYQKLVKIALAIRNSQKFAFAFLISGSVAIPL